MEKAVDEVGHSRAVIVKVPFIALLPLIMLLILAPVFNPVVCISATDDITQVMVVSAMPLTVLLRWSDAAGRVPTGTMSVVTFVTPVSVFLVVDWICYGCCI
jgi:hypothetical protein